MSLEPDTYLVNRVQELEAENAHLRALIETAQSKLNALSVAAHAVVDKYRKAYPGVQYQVPNPNTGD